MFKSRLALGLKAFVCINALFHIIVASLTVIGCALRTGLGSFSTSQVHNSLLSI